MRRVVGEDLGFLHAAVRDFGCRLILIVCYYDVCKLSVLWRCLPELSLLNWFVRRSFFVLLYFLQFYELNKKS